MKKPAATIYPILAVNRCNTPILLIAFNRPAETLRVLEAIKSAGASRLYVVADGPRPHSKTDQASCAEVRRIIEAIDWIPGGAITNFSESNLGCKERVSSGISWFFEREERGIILEDDCLPNGSFFPFCETMLSRYEDDERVGMITGGNLGAPLSGLAPDQDYLFTRITYIWGWAAWRRSWNKYDIGMTRWTQLKKERWAYRIFRSWTTAKFFEDYFDMAYDGRASTWDIQWLYSSLLAEQLCIVPVRNMISNIGFVGTHTDAGAGGLLNMPVEEMDTENLRGGAVAVNQAAEDLMLEIHGASRLSARRLAMHLAEIIGLKRPLRYFYRKLRGKN